MTLHLYLPAEGRHEAAHALNQLRLVPGAKGERSGGGKQGTTTLRERREVAWACSRDSWRKAANNRSRVAWPQKSRPRASKSITTAGALGPTHTCKEKRRQRHEHDGRGRSIQRQRRASKQQRDRDPAAAVAWSVGRLLVSTQAAKQEAPRSDRLIKVPWGIHLDISQRIVSKHSGGHFFSCSIDRPRTPQKPTSKFGRSDTRPIPLPVLPITCKFFDSCFHAIG